MAGVKRMPASARLGLRFAERRGITTSAKRYFKVDTNADYDTGKKPTREKVRVKGLTATQNTIHSGFKAQKNPSKKPISVYRTPGGKNVIMEGHHRSARALVRGDTHVDALVYRRRFKKSALEALDEAIAKAGLIKPGKPSLLRRVGFLLSTGSNERNYRVGRYLESRKRGKGFGPKGKRRARTGTYTGVYATGVNKSEAQMSAIELLDEAIEKARGMIPRGGSSKLARRLSRQGAKLQSKGGDPKEAKRFAALGTLDNRKRGKAFGVGGYTPGKGYGSVTRRGVYKSADAPTALDQLDEAIEKARGLMPKGGSTKMNRRALLGQLGGNKASKRRLRTLERFTAERQSGYSKKHGFGRGKLKLREGQYT